MTADAALGRGQAKPCGIGMLDVVVGVTVGTGRHVLVPLLDQGLAMHARGVLLVHVHMTAGAALRDHGLLLVGVLDVMRAVAVGAYGNRVETVFQVLVVNAFQRAGVGVEVALLAHLVGADHVLPFAGKSGAGGMIFVVLRMAVSANEIGSMHRSGEILGRQVQIHLRAILELENQLLVGMAFETVRDAVGKFLRTQRDGEGSCDQEQTPRIGVRGLWQPPLAVDLFG